MKLVNFQAVEGPVQAGVLRGDRVHSLGSLGFHSVKQALEAGETGLSRVRQMLEGASADGGIAVSGVRILAPLADAQKLIFIGLNYKDHAAEAGMPLPTVPTVFSKFANTVIHPDETILLP